MVIKKTSRHNSLFLDIKKGGKQKKLQKNLLSGSETYSSWIQIRNLIRNFCIGSATLLKNIVNFSLGRMKDKFCQNLSVRYN